MRLNEGRPILLPELTTKHLATAAIYAAVATA